MKAISFIALLLISLSGLGQTYNVTFQVDMTTQSGFTTPEVNGSFNNWCGNCAPMSDPEGDNIWTLTIPLAAGSYEFKYSADNWGIQESLLEGSPCTVTAFGFTNRALSVTQDTTLTTVCWGSCTDCASTPNYYDVTFLLDMNGQTGFTTPEVNGTFNGWCGNCTAMSDADADNVWQVTVTLPEGSYEYKFSADNWNTQENLAAGSACTITTGAYTNRTLNVTQDIALDTVCWASCSACGQNTGPFNVTFNVDMSQVPFNFTTPEINGTFNNWCGNCAVLADPENDNIWSITIPLAAGSYTYKFSYDNWTGQEELNVGSTCTFTENGFTNRLIDVSDNVVLPNVCWESCDVCVVGVNENSQNKISVYPNPARDFLQVNGTDAQQKIAIWNSFGELVQQRNASDGNTLISFDNLPSGLYFLTLQQAGIFQAKIQFVVE
ncbi:MAG: hypothetical protein RL062_1120 [Bacteroidota bacterium]